MIKSNKVFFNIIRLLTYFVIGYLSFLIFYYQAYQGFDTDLPYHVDRINPIITGQYYLPHSFFHYLVYYIHLIFAEFSLHTSMLNIAIWLLSALIVIILDITYRIFVARVDKEHHKLTLLFASVSLIFVTPIYLWFFNKNLYLGQWSPNIWHNPTILLLKPFAIVTLFFTIIYFSENQIFNKIWVKILFSLFIALSTWAKPSFVISFIPATYLYLFFYHKKIFKSFVNASLLFLPTIAVLALQFLQTYSQDIQSTNDLRDTIVFTFFGVTKLYSPNVFISLLLAIAFPLFLLIVDFKNCLKDQYLMLSWLNTVIAYLYASFLAEKFKFDQGAFTFGYSLALLLLFIFSLIHFLKFYHYNKAKFSYICLTLLFSLHLCSGIYYFFNYLLTGIYF
jgi:hypothetical protein